jgi:hypothetical protein
MTKIMPLDKIIIKFIYQRNRCQLPCRPHCSAQNSGRYRGRERESAREKGGVRGGGRREGRKGGKSGRAEDWTKISSYFCRYVKRWRKHLCLFLKYGLVFVFTTPTHPRTHTGSVSRSSCWQNRRRRDWSSKAAGISSQLCMFISSLEDGVRSFWYIFILSLTSLVIGEHTRSYVVCFLLQSLRNQPFWGN